MHYIKGVISIVRMRQLESMDELIKRKARPSTRCRNKKSTITNLADQLGDFLSENGDSKNDQERVLVDLWSVANEDEQQSLANVMVKLVQNNLK